jgi:hypothetical protein
MLAKCKFNPGRDKSGNRAGGVFDVDYVWKIEGMITRTSHPFFVDLPACAPPLGEPLKFVPSNSSFGTTRLVFELDSAGQVKAARIVLASGPDVGHSELDLVALRSLERCRFARPLAGTEVTVDYDWTRGPASHGVQRYEAQEQLTRRLAMAKGQFITTTTVAPPPAPVTIAPPSSGSQLAPAPPAR